MLLRHKKIKQGFLLLLIVPLIISFSFTAHAAYYNTYTTVANITNSSYSNCQGFAVGSTYAYSAKLSNQQPRAILYRTNMDTGSTIQLTNGDTGEEYATYMGHANDMTVCSLNNKSHLFILSGDDSLVKVKIDGKKFYKMGTFYFKCNGEPSKVTGINILSKTDTTITFLCKNGVSYYIGSININANSGDINLTYKFKINVKDALVNGQKVDYLDKYKRQGIGYSRGTLYVPLYGYNSELYPGIPELNHPERSIILVYRNVNASTTGTITADPDLSFRVTSRAYTKWEIEGCGVRSGGQLWFNTNRHDASGIQNDGVHYWNDYMQQ